MFIKLTSDLTREVTKMNRYNDPSEFCSGNARYDAAYYDWPVTAPNHAVDEGCDGQSYDVSWWVMGPSLIVLLVFVSYVSFS